MRLSKMSRVEALALAVGSIGILPAEAPMKHEGIHLANEARFTAAYYSEPLTTFAVGWRDPSPITEIMEFLAPTVRVGRRFEYKEFLNQEEWYSESDDDRAIGADFKRVEYKGVSKLGQTENRGLSIVVDLDEVREVANWRELYTGRLQRRLNRNEFRRTWALAVAAATNNAKTWDTTAGKDPDQDVLTDLVAATDDGGIRPNRLIYGDTAWSKRVLAHRAQSLSGGFASAGLSATELAGFLGVENVMVSRERYQSSSSAKSQIVSNLVLEFYAESSPMNEDPSNLKRFVSEVEGGGYWRVYEQQISSKLVLLTVEFYSLPKVTATTGLRTLTIS